MNNHEYPETQERDAPESALETQLRAYFSAKADPTPAELWQRLAPHLDATTTSATSSLRRAPTLLATLVRDDDEAPPPLRRNAPPTRRNRFMRGVASAASLVAVLALVLGAVALFHRAPGTTGPGVIHSGALTWQPVSLPAGVRLANAYATTTGVAPNHGTPGAFTYHLLTPAEEANADLVVAPSNGNVAYISELPTKRAPLLWRTTNAGQHWTPLPSPPNRGYKSGNLLLDQNDPFTLIATYTTAARPSGQSAYDAYALLNGSRQWLPIYSGPVTWGGLGNLASWHGVYYSTLITTAPNGFFRSDLLASTDGMRSWNAIDGQIIAKDHLAPTGETGVASFWVNPTTGDLLATTYNETRTGELWMSVDHGANWSEVVLPPSPVSEVGETNNWVTGAILWVQSPPIGESFRLCAGFTEQPSSDAPTFYCSRDSGKTWTKRTPTSASQNLELTNVLLPNGAGIGITATALYLNPRDDARLTSPRFISALPDAHGGPWDGARWGVTAHVVTFWAATNANVLYVAQYTLPDM
ncbi:MAG TPA: hypothetical protein VMV29_05685 [Ktedonobacterales bacterium]|nr:hypothetical protein [Ktedonobacterales bacterium]